MKHSSGCRYLKDSLGRIFERLISTLGCNDRPVLVAMKVAASCLLGSKGTQRVGMTGARWTLSLCRNMLRDKTSLMSQPAQHVVSAVTTGTWRALPSWFLDFRSVVAQLSCHGTLTLLLFGQDMVPSQ